MAQGQKPFYIVFGVVALVGVALVGRKYLSSSAPVSIPVNATISVADTSGFSGYLIGSPTAPVEVTEYADYQCPACQAFATMQLPDVMQRLIESGKARLRYRDFPLDDKHRHARVAAHAAACANDQGKFWEMGHGLYARQPDWQLIDNPMAIFREVAVSTGIDADKWGDCMKAATYAGRIQASLDEGNRLGVLSTPSFVIGGRLYEGMTGDQMVRIVDSIIGAAPVSKP